MTQNQALPKTLTEAIRYFTAYSDESGRRFRANPTTHRSPATQGLRFLSEVAGFRPISPGVFAWILL